jgi:predicted MPP superfamily phosphohydrolase
LPGETDTALALVHEPDYFPTMIKSTPMRLQFSGHSHGGQVRIAPLGPLILPRLGRIYHSGLYELNGRFVYTGRGLGMVGLPLRFDCPPELTEITLVAA